MKDKSLVLNNVRIFPGCAASLPQFYFPLGRPEDSTVCENALDKVKKIFQLSEEGLSKEEFGAVAKVIWFFVYVSK